MGYIDGNATQIILKNRTRCVMVTVKTIKKSMDKINLVGGPAFRAAPTVPTRLLALTPLPKFVTLQS